MAVARPTMPPEPLQKKNNRGTTPDGPGQIRRAPGLRGTNKNTHETATTLTIEASRLAGAAET
eukprot:12558746-Alexandrium_andersonii.AAC.1